MNKQSQPMPVTPRRHIVISGATGFIGANLVRHFYEGGAINQIRAVHRSELPTWYEKLPGVSYLRLDLTKQSDCYQACEGADEVYNLACDVGGLGFMNRCHVENMRNVLINTQLLEAACFCGVKKYFFPSSACVYDVAKANSLLSDKLTEDDAVPARPERGYGWERLFSEMLCQEYWIERGLKTYIARLNNVYGPYCRFEGDRVRVVPALCRAVISAVKSQDRSVTVWGDGSQLRTFLHVDDCVRGIDMIVQSQTCIGRPVNLSADEPISINDILAILEQICGVRLNRRFDLEKPVGVRTRVLDTSIMKSVLNWKQQVSLVEGISNTYDWIKTVYQP